LLRFQNFNPILGKNELAVMAITESRSGWTHTATITGWETIMKTIFVIMALTFAFTTGMAVTTVLSQIAS
jgi:hypothetical protein